MNKLLILGATYNEIDIIKCARNKGIYTIVTDNNLDWSKSPAKYIADEAWNISWSDIDTLYKKSIDNNKLNIAYKEQTKKKLANRIKEISEEEFLL